MTTEEQQMYPKTARSAINRHKERGHYDAETIHDLINSTPVAHVSFVPDPSDPLPVVLPMIARVGTFPGGDGEAAVYIHGYVSARLFREGASRTGDGGGVPVCIAATKIDALVLALTPFNHSYDYRSAVVHGTAALLDPAPAADRDEVLWAMRLITDGMVPGRWAGSRVPPDEAELASTRILRVRVDAASAKVRAAGVRDDARDLRDDATRARVWTGTIPYVEVLGQPAPAESNRVAAVPAYVEDHVRRHNERAGAGEGQGGIVSRVMASLFGTGR